MATNTRALAVINNLLDKQYDAYQNLVNYGFEFLDMVDKQAAERSLTGEKFYLPYNAKRQGTGAYIDEGGAIGTPRQIVGETTEFDITEYVDRLAISWRFLAMDKGNKALKMSFQDRLTIALDENREKLDKDAIYGGKVRGFLNERPVAGVGSWSAAATTAAGSAGAIFTDLQYDGDYTPFLNAVVGTPATWVPVQLVCADDYAYIAAGHGLTLGGATGVELYVAGINLANETLKIGLVSTGGFGSAGDWQTAGVIEAGYTVAVELKPDLWLSGTGTVAYWTTTGYKEMTGAFTNLFAQSWGGKDRSSSDRPYTRAVGYTMANAGAHARAAFSPTRLTKFLAAVEIQGGQQPTKVICNPLVKASYVDATTTVSGAAIGRRSYNDGGNVDMVPTSLTIAGDMFNTSKNMPLGILLFLDLSHWTVLVPMDGSKNMIDWRRYDGQPDGPIWRDDANAASAVCTLYGIFQLVAKAPNKGNGVITGIVRV